MRTRLLSALVLVPLVLAAVLVGGRLWAGGLAVAALLGTREGYRLARASGQRPTAPLGYGLAAALVLLAPQPAVVQLPLVLAVMAAFAVQLVRPPGARSSVDWAVTLGYPLALGLLLGFGVLLRARPDGLAWLALLLALVWANDTAAYLVGRYAGHTPFFGSISPKKTQEGALAGTAASVLVGALAPSVAGWLPAGVATGMAARSPLALAAIGLSVAVLGPMGDLSISFLKRQAGVKDTGALIPGHGGVLDRIDSLLFTVPAVYYAARLLGT